MHIDLWTLALQTVNVVVLIWLLSRFLYRPVANAIAARQAVAGKTLAEAEQRLSAVQAQAAELKRQTDELAAAEADVLAKARANAEAERAAVLREAGEDVAKQRAQVRANLEREAAAVRKRLESEAVMLAADMTRALLRRAPVAAVTEAMFADLLVRLRALAPAEQAQFFAPGAAVTVTTADPASEADQARYARELQEAVPGLGRVAFAVDPDLIAGFELAGPNLVVSNSWRADLAQVALALGPGETSADAG
jgi:F-type H+-transporting ATPase subunit b